MPSRVPEFYAVAAQVLPVLFLTLAFQLRGGFIPSPAEDHYEKFVALRPKLVEVVKEAQKLRWPDDLSTLTPEQRLAMDSAAQDYSEQQADDEINRLAAAAERSRVISAAASIVALGLLFLGETMALRVILRGDETEAAAIVVQVALFAGGAMIAWPLLDKYVERIATVHYKMMTHRYRIAMTLLGLLLALTYISWH